MKSQVKLIFCITFCMVFFLARLNAQNEPLPIKLTGEWIIKGKDHPKVNDTLTLTKELLNKADYTKWIFDISNKLWIIHNFDIKKSEVAWVSVSNAQPSEWYYDNSTKLLRISYAVSDQYFKIINTKNQILRLVLVK